jgi:hypothetical protein
LRVPVDANRLLKFPVVVNLGKLHTVEHSANVKRVALVRGGGFRNHRRLFEGEPPSSPTGTPQKKFDVQIKVKL